MRVLIGLNDSYTAVQGNILMMKLLPTISQAYSLLIQEEKQREISAESQYIPEAISLNVKTVNSSGNQFSKMIQEGFRTKFDPKKLVCEYYKKHGHQKEKCFELHGFPPNYKSNRDKRFAAIAPSGSLDSLHATHNAGIAHVPELTAVQYNKLMNFLNGTSAKGSQLHQETDFAANSIEKSNFAAASTSMAVIHSNLFLMLKDPLYSVALASISLFKIPG